MAYPWPPTTTPAGRPAANVSIDPVAEARLANMSPEMQVQTLLHAVAEKKYKVEKLHNELALANSKVDSLEDSLKAVHKELAAVRKELAAKDKKMMSDTKVLNTIKKLVESAPTAQESALALSAAARRLQQPQVSEPASSGYVAAKGPQMDNNFHLKVHFSKKAVIIDQNGQVHEKTEDTHEAKKRRKREAYQESKKRSLERSRMQKEEEEAASKKLLDTALEDAEVGTMTSSPSALSVSTASGSSGAAPSEGKQDCMMSDDTVDGEPSSKKMKVNPSEDGQDGASTGIGDPK